MKSFSLLIKPASADCNLRCEYCFYRDRCNLYPRTAKHRMSDSVLERLVRTFMETDQPQYIFGWQGGEPTLMGTEFFKKVVKLQARHGRSGAVVGNGVQTNGTLINDDMARLFADYRFLLGVSLDGPEPIHDQYRRNAAGSGSHAQVMHGIEHLQKHGAAFNILTLVSRSNAAHGAAVYNYLTDHGFLHHQYIPCVEPGAAGQGLAPFAIDGSAWGDFLCVVFDAWVARDTRRVSVRLFDSILSVLVDNRRNACHMGVDCSHYMVVEHNGDVYPCDFFVEKDLRLGNVQHNTWEELQRDPAYRAFAGKKQDWNAVCDECQWQRFCGGDCLKHRLLSRDNRPRNLSVLCRGWKQFYAHAIPAFEKLAAEITTARAAGEIPTQQQPPGKPGRNDPCPCGSGKKYKKCCGR